MTIYYVYILKSLKLHRHYIGHAENVEIRLAKHNQGRIRSTKAGMPWKVVYTEKYLTRGEAYRRELEIKRFKGGVQFKALLSGTLRKR